MMANYSSCDNTMNTNLHCYSQASPQPWLSWIHPANIGDGNQSTSDICLLACNDNYRLDGKLENLSCAVWISQICWSLFFLGGGRARGQRAIHIVPMVQWRHVASWKMSCYSKKGWSSKTKKIAVLLHRTSMVYYLHHYATRIFQGLKQSQAQFYSRFVSSSSPDIR